MAVYTKKNDLYKRRQVCTILDKIRQQQLPANQRFANTVSLRARTASFAIACFAS